MEETELSCDTGSGDGFSDLLTHQKIVRDYINLYTPYRGILLYHGLGSGKTCSAITICEEYRLQNTSFNKDQRILIMASKNVQDNFRIQLFDDRKLELINELDINLGKTPEEILRNLE